ncbi:MAG: FAD-dependent oxidoreductase [Candidatus Nanoarchaeia archaeon]|nr:FAD-dependent oxidoreductase [Candidatus Nanoarchaeia archaeon]MDD5238902.1 FAD-dependent oxidoreductase [Candidatus Nanoarchaeia archaeon]
MEYDVIIIGGGVAGLSAALQAKRFNLNTLVIAKEIGGLLNIPNPVENYPGLGATTGMEIIKKIRQHAEKFKPEIKEETVIDCKKNGNVFAVKTENSEYHGKSIVFATGSDRRKLDVLGEKEHAGKGVSYCASCDGALFRNKTVAVAGGNDSAAKEALLLTQYAKKVYIIYRGEKIRAEPMLAGQVEKNPKIEIITNTNIRQINGKIFVDSIILDRAYKGSTEMKIDGLFVEVGHIPSSVLAAELGVKLNEAKEIMVDRESKTNVQGIFAAGDVTDSGWKQAIIAASQGSFAAFSAYKFVKTK